MTSLEEGAAATAGVSVRVAVNESANETREPTEEAADEDEEEAEDEAAGIIRDDPVRGLADGACVGKAKAPVVGCCT